MRIRILASAQDDLEIGFRFYERQQEGLGWYFLESLFAEIDCLLQKAGIHSKRFGYYRLLSKKFPYAVYYNMDNGCIQVWAVLDCRREPSRMRARLARLRRSAGQQV